MRNALSFAALAAISATLSGCVTHVGVDNPINSNNAEWNNFVTGTLVTRYPGKTPEDVFKAASIGIEKYGAFRVGQITPLTKDSGRSASSYEVVARTLGDIQISIVISTARNPRTKEEWTQLSVQYGTWGNVKESQKIVSFITQSF